MGRKGEPGFALITVIAILGVLSAAVAITAYQTRVSALDARAGHDQSRMRSAIEGAVWRAEIGLNAEDENRRWQPDGRLYEIQEDDIAIRIRPVASNGRFDLNTGDPETLQRLLGELGVGLGQAAAIGAALQDWRDEDSDPTLGGGEAAIYRSRGQAAPGDRPLVAREEFRSVMGVDGPIFRAARLYLTVDTGDVEPAFAPPALLRALDLPSSEISRVLAARQSSRPAMDQDGYPAFDPAPSARYALLIEAETEAGAFMAMEIEISSAGDGQPMRVIRRSPLARGEADRLFDESAR
jgi:general secretion pathway protein K